MRDTGGGADRQGRCQPARSCHRATSGAVPRGAGAARRARSRLSGDRSSDEGTDWHGDVAARARSPAVDGQHRDGRADGKNMTAAMENDPRLLVHAYVDGELDPAHALEVERQLAADPALAAERERIEALRHVIQERLPRLELPPGLARRIEAAVAT